MITSQQIKKFTRPESFLPSIFSEVAEALEKYEQVMEMLKQTQRLHLEDASHDHCPCERCGHRFGPDDKVAYVKCIGGNMCEDHATPYHIAQEILEK